uniref:Uncharacterized protein n=1 Tax=Mesocestoides corti TaxID=53468 RepID=A0A5K3ETV9_MESCO
MKTFDQDMHEHSCTKVNLQRKKLKSAQKQQRHHINHEEHNWSQENICRRRLRNKWDDYQDVELNLRQLDDEKIKSMPPSFWKEMVVRVQYLLDTNRLLRADVAHLSGEHHCPLYTCKFSGGCCAQTFYSSPPVPTNHDDCDRRCQELENEIEVLKRERARLRRQSSSVQDLIRSIGQRQVTLHRDLINSRQLEAENALQRRLVYSYL